MKTLSSQWRMTHLLMVLGYLCMAGQLCVFAESRTWTSKSGKQIEAEYVSTTLSDEVLLEKSDGLRVKVPLSELSASDLDYIALQNPPKLKIEFSDKSQVSTLDSSDRWPDNPAVTKEIVRFKLSIKQEGTKEYGFGLTAEYYAIAYQYLDHDKYCLLQKGRKKFVLNDDNNHSIEISTKPLNLPLEFTLDTNHYGRKYCAYLVLVTDQRGEVIAYRTSKSWLFEHRDALEKLPVGAFFDDTCIRRHASQPKVTY